MPDAAGVGPRPGSFGHGETTPCVGGAPGQQVRAAQAQPQIAARQRFGRHLAQVESARGLLELLAGAVDIALVQVQQAEFGVEVGAISGQQARHITLRSVMELRWLFTARSCTLA